MSTRVQTGFETDAYMKLCETYFETEVVFCGQGFRLMLDDFHLFLLILKLAKYTSIVFFGNLLKEKNVNMVYP